MHSLARFAMARGLLNPAEVNVLTELTNLRNRVVHQDDAVVTAESANRYAALALALAPYWKNRAPTPVPRPLRDPALQDAIFSACDRMVGVG
jgi:hypothetical protein